MSKHAHDHHAIAHPPGAPGAAVGFDPETSIAGSIRKPVSDHEYAAEMGLLQIELVKLQRHVIARREKILLVIEGRDAAGKDDIAKHIVEHLSPRDSRVVALGQPSDRELAGWYFQRHAAQLPGAGEIVVFNRSWYNRAGVEHVMGFCSKEELEEFFQSVPGFEQSLASGGVKLLKLYLDVGRASQARRLAHRQLDPLRKWKSSHVNETAVEYWKAYTDARNAMLLRTHTTLSPWQIVHADNSRLARLNLIRKALAKLHYEGKNHDVVQPDPDVAFDFTPECIASERLAL
jgi:polyphosphate kinase 2